MQKTKFLSSSHLYALACIFIFGGIIFSDSPGTSQTDPTFITSDASSISTYQVVPEIAIIPDNQSSNPVTTSNTPSVVSPVIESRAEVTQTLENTIDGRADTKLANTIISKDGAIYPLRVYQTMLTPNDPSYNQWWVAPNGMTSVWDITNPARQTKIAIIDTGFALNHQEFTNRWAVNNGEFGSTTLQSPSDLNCTDRGLALNRSCNNIDDDFDGIVDNESGTTTKQNPSKRNCTDLGIALNKNCNNRDDDGNGYVDDYRGWDFSNFDASPLAGEINPNGTGTTHGTRVAGVLGATGNNGVGIAGVNWYTKILPLQALDDDSYGDTFTVGEAVRYAADQGADVISISLGTSADDPYMRAAILYALDRGSLIVAASGNDGCNCISYPANYPEVISVGALAPTGTPASFSSYGANLDILAPGQSILTSSYTSSNQVSSYATVSGTSFATPFFAGLMGLARSSQPNAAWEEILGSMYENADRTGLSSTNPRTDTLGFGVTRSNTMLNRLRNPYATTIRYQLGTTATLGSARSYQCDPATIPATRLYRLTRSGQMNYTANLRSLSQAISEGWSAQQIATTCIGLPTDSITTLRTLDLARELSNSTSK